MATNRRKARTEKDGASTQGSIRPGPKPTLTRQTIVQTAIDIADSEGIEAVTMQRLGEAFGFTPMSVYRYVHNKAEVVEAMIDAALGAPPPKKRGHDWRSLLEEWARGILACFARHPWTLAATSRLRTMGPNELAWTDRALSALASAGLTPGDQHGALLALVGHVRGVAQFSIHVPGARPGIGLAEWRSAAAATAGADLSALRAALEAGAFAGRDGGLAPGLRIVFEGIAAVGRRRNA